VLLHSRNRVLFWEKASPVWEEEQNNRSVPSWQDAREVLNNERGRVRPQVSAHCGLEPAASHAHLRGIVQQC